MTKFITFVTGNPEKVRDALQVAEDYDVEVEHIALDIDEIQHQDPLKITEHKTKSAYALLGKPVVVNDSFWTIPALGGFPGGYMKDVSNWLSTDDFIILMSNKDDQSIILTDVNGYYDGSVFKYFKTERPGRFINEPRGKSGPAHARVVVMESDDITIAEIFDQQTRRIDSTRYAQWYDFMKWFSERD